MSDATLRTLRREFEAGDYPSGARLVVELLRRGLHEQLGAPAPKSWASAWCYHEETLSVLGSSLVKDENGLTVGQWDPEGPRWTVPLVLLAGTNAINDDGSDMEWRWIGRIPDGRWFLVEAGCDYTGWDCQSGAKVLHLGELDGLAMAIDTDTVRMLLDGRATPQGGTTP